MQTGTGATTLTATTRLDNTGGQIATNGGLNLTVGEFVNQQGSLQIAGGDLGLTATGKTQRVRLREMLKQPQ